MEAQENVMESKPLISVIMSVYNEQQYIGEALMSILTQTVQDFEIIIFDDGSTDHTIDIVNKLQDKRVRVYQNEQNRGLTSNLNQALEMASGQYIARMDGDDISMPKRFERQIRYLNTHPDIMLISCQTQTFGDENLISKVEINPEKLRCMMLVRPVLAHPGFMFRKELFDRYGFRYDESFRQAQDYELVSRITRKFQIGICPHVLLKYRAHKEQVSSKANGKQFANADRVREFLLGELDIHLTCVENEFYHKLVLEQHTEDIQDFIQVRILLETIMEQNKQKKIYQQEMLEKTMREALCLWIIRNKSRKIYQSTRLIWGSNMKYQICYMSQWLALVKRKCIEKTVRI